jgi:hypothetical protein
MWAKIAAGTESGPISIANGSGPTMQLGIYEFGGMLPDVLANVVDRTQVQSESNSTSHSSGNTAATQQTQEVAIAFWGLSGQPTNPLLSNSFTPMLGGGSGERAYAGYKILSSTGAQNSVLSHDNTLFGVGVIATFRVNMGQNHSRTLGGTVLSGTLST